VNDRELADRVEILELYARYEQLCDQGPWEAVVALYATDGVFVNSAGTIEGHDDLLTHYAGWRDDPRFAAMAPGRHLFTTPAVTITGETATGSSTSMFILPGTAGEAPTLAHLTVYDDQLSRSTGPWRFTSRTVRLLA
jgi:hypothetical protein